MAKVSPAEAEKLAASLAEVDADADDGFFAVLGAKLSSEGVPAVGITFKDLSVVVQASTSKNALPSLPNVIMSIPKALSCRGGAATEPLTILNSLSGTICPARLTLLLGPPSCGKTTFLQALAGRLPAGKYTGTVEYNGRSFDDFCAERSAVFVAQSDTHIPNLTARETADFSYDLQHGPKDTMFKAGAALDARNSAHADAGGGRDGKPGAPDVKIDSLKPGTAVRDMTAAEFEELTQLMLDGPGRVDLIMEFFGLTRAKSTWVGNQMHRGISGGERKRLSTVEMLMGSQQVYILDEISTGLDAATLFNVIRWLRAWTHNLRSTMLISLLQPPPETFVLFDDLFIMNAGVIVYHGTVSGAVAHMERLGFLLPPRKDVPSWLQEVTTVRGQHEYASAALRRQHGVPADLDTDDEVVMADRELLISLQEMADFAARPPASAATPPPPSSAYQSEVPDSLGTDMMLPAMPSLEAGNDGADDAPAAPAQPAKDAALLDKRGGPGDGALVPNSAPYTWAALPMLARVLSRQGKLFRRDPTLTRARLAQVVIVGLLIGGLWFDLPVTAEDARTFMSATFLMTMFMAFGGMPQLAVMLQNRVVWFKHRANNMYTASAYAWSAALVQLPLSVVEALIFTVIVYFMVGFSTDGARYFFLAYATLLTSSLALTSIFRFVGALFQSPATANAASGFMLLMLVINSGFIITRGAIPPWIVWAYWISPFAYGIRALVVNEFTSPRWQNLPSRVEGVSLGDVSLEQLDFFTERKWIYIGIGFNVGVFLLLTQATALALHMLQPPKRPVVIKRKEQIRADLLTARKAREAAQAALQQVGASKELVTGGRTAGHAAAAGADADDEGAVLRASHRRASAAVASVASAFTFTPISVVWRDLCYYVTVAKGLTGAAALNVMPDDADKAIAGKKRLLNSLTGYAMPGVLTALMGGSGAGKTTLMDVLAGRKTEGRTTGAVLVNGHAKVQQTWARVVGYVEQTDVHSAALTVEESLRFSAGLRLTDDVSPAMRDAYVLEVLLVTELLDIRGNVVGSPGEDGLSVEQRRRLSIGVELVSNPSVVFLDEPTSGLDARSAAAVMGAVRNVASNGRTVMVTIHQPSIEIFESFDRLVLLGMGGESIYVGRLGEESRALVAYFQSIPGVPALPDQYNPATWMLEVSGGGAKMHTEAVKADFGALYRASAACRETNERADAIAAAARQRTEPLSLANRYAATRGRQIAQVTKKLFLVYWRSPNYTVARFIVTIITALVFGVTWWQEGDLPGGGAPAEFSHVQNIAGSLYAGLSFMGMTNLIAGLPLFIAERNVMYRERAASMYAVMPYAFATGVVEIPYLLAQACVFVPITYFMIGFQASAEPIFLFIIVFMQSITLYTFMGQLFSYLVPTPPIALMLGGLSHLLWNIFNGFLVPIPQMAAGWKWLNYISATTYVIYALAISQLGDSSQPIVVAGYGTCSRANLTDCPSVSRFMDDYFGYEYSFRWWCVLILAAFIILFRVASMVALKFVNHEHR